MLGESFAADLDQLNKLGENVQVQLSLLPAVLRFVRISPPSQVAVVHGHHKNHTLLGNAKVMQLADSGQVLQPLQDANFLESNYLHSLALSTLLINADQAVLLRQLMCCCHS